MAQTNEQLVRNLYQAYNDRDFDYGPSQSHSDIEIRVVPLGTTLQGKDGLRQYLQDWAAAFPDSRVEVVNVVAGENAVVVEFVGRGTHGGPLQSPAGEIPATGRRVEIPFCDVHELRDGKIARQRTYFDTATMLRQLGVIE
jgi:steroid delta-isomerase-like uncharacterized protein